MACKCGSDSHKRTNAKDCPLNPKRRRQEAQESATAATLVLPAPTLNDLPTEIKISIINSIPIGDVWVVGQLCRSLRELVGSKRYWQNRPNEHGPLHETGQPLRVTQRTACDVYRLSAKELAAVPAARKRNPHYRSAEPMKLFDIGLVQGLAFAKHGGPPGVTAARIKSEQRKEKLQKTKFDGYRRREQELEDALKAKGLELRDDSVISDMYITGKRGAYTLERTVEIAERMHIIHEHSNYKKLLDNAYSDIRMEIRDQRDRDYDDFLWEGQIDFKSAWAEAKVEAEADALDNFNTELEKYQALPEAKQKEYRMCECGRPFLKIQ
ncbi:hypothetical protein HDU86_007802 [Geranomyces michiganensis]|nr:hypothetical protein HDU86_007802 [Geranomyces michiganensis]